MGLGFRPTVGSSGLKTLNLKTQLRALGLNVIRPNNSHHKQKHNKKHLVLFLLLNLVLMIVLFLVLNFVLMIVLFLVLNFALMSFSVAKWCAHDCVLF